MRQMTITTFEGEKFEISFHRTADNCYRCEFPNRFGQSLVRASKYHDQVIEDALTGKITWHCGSLHRMLEFVATYIGESEL